MGVAIVAQETVVIVEENARQSAERIRALRFRRRVERDERHRLGDRLDGFGRAHEIGPVARSHARRSVNRPQSRRPGDRDDVKAPVVAKFVKRPRSVGAEDDDRVAFPRGERVKSLRQRLVGLIWRYPSRENNILPLIDVALSRSPKLTVRP